MNEINEYIKKQESPKKEILNELNKIIEPLMNEAIIKGGVPCYGVSKENPYGLTYIVGLKDHVNIGFLINKLSKESIQLLTGNGKTMKVIEIKTLKDINKTLIIKLIKEIKN